MRAMRFHRIIGCVPIFLLLSGSAAAQEARLFCVPADESACFSLALSTSPNGSGETAVELHVTNFQGKDVPGVLQASSAQIFAIDLVAPSSFAGGPAGPLSVETEGKAQARGDVTGRWYVSDIEELDEYRGYALYTDVEGAGADLIGCDSPPDHAYPYYRTCPNVNTSTVVFRFPTSGVWHGPEAGIAVGIRVPAGDIGCEIPGTMWDSPDVPNCLVLGAPSAPISIQGTLDGFATIAVTWDFEGSEGYRFVLDRRAAGAVGEDGNAWTPVLLPNATDRSFVDVTVDPGESYRYRVRACSIIGCSPFTASSWIATSVKPAEPLNFRAQGRPDAVRLDWFDASANEEHFKIQRRAWNGIDAWGAWMDLEDAVAGAESAIDSDVSGNARYRYRLRSCNIAGCSVWVTIPSVTTDTVQPGVPASVNLTGSGDGTTLSLSWVDVQDEVHYRVQQRHQIAASTTWSLWTSHPRQPADAVGIEETAEAGHVYQYRVRACNYAGCSSWRISNAFALP